MVRLPRVGASMALDRATRTLQRRAGRFASALAQRRRLGWSQDCWAVDIEEGSRKDEGGSPCEVSVPVASSAVAENIEQRETAKEQMRKAKLKADGEKLLKVYQKYPQGETAKVIREAAGLNPTRFVPANQKLVDDGLIEACRIKKHTREENAFRLRTSDAGTGGTVPEQIPPVQFRQGL